MLSAARPGMAGQPVSRFYSGFNSHDGQAKVQPSLVRGPGEAWGGSAPPPHPGCRGGLGAFQAAAREEAAVPGSRQLVPLP